jgi:alanine dehydrogenase
MLSVGIPKEIKVCENRVSLIPEDIKKIVDSGILVYFQKGTGVNSGYNDYEYIEVGAIMVDTIEDIYKFSKLIVKVKEPQESEYKLINNTHTIFTFFHFASDQLLVDNMKSSGASCYPYEIIKIKKEGGEIYYPILSNMSVIAGEQSFNVADLFIKSNYPNHSLDIDITIIGAGNVGISAMKIAISLGYKNINLIDNNYQKLLNIKLEYDNLANISIYNMDSDNLKFLMKKSIITIGSIYNTGMKADRLLTNEILDSMPDGAIIMDVAIDQGGITEQSKITSIDEPIIKYKGINIYCVPNIPSTAPRKASILLSNSIVDYVKALSTNNQHLYPELLKENIHLWTF